MTLQGETIVVTGATGQVGFPVAVALAEENEVVAPARFSDPAAKERLAAEAVARLSARLHDLPTTIARLNVPYGDNGGWPAIMLMLAQMGMATDVPVGGSPARYNPIHEDDIVAMVPKLLEIAAVPAVTVNWGGEEVASIQEWCAYITELTGVEIPLEEGASAMPSVVADLTKQHELVGRATVGWKDGFRRMLETRHPDFVK